MKVSIIMAYHNRKRQVIRTLDGFQNNYFDKYNFEVIIVDDNSSERHKLHDILSNYKFPLQYIVISEEEKQNYVNPCIVFNKGFSLATGQIVMIQNPECYHVGDLLAYAFKMQDNEYVNFSCYTVNSFELTNELFSGESHDNTKILATINDQNFSSRNEKLLGTIWYNHPLYKPVNFHFCSIIYKCKLDLIGGFDKRYGDGYCFDDAEFLLSIQHILKLNVKTISPNTNDFVIHQFHERGSSFNIDLAPDSNVIKQKWLKNKALYENKIRIHTENLFYFPKLLHLYWDGSKLSFLNYLTILSFNRYHQDWKINIYLPKSRNNIMSWGSSEQKLRYNGICYLEKLKNIHNVSIHYIDLNEIGFRNDASEVIKSDYFRYYILHKHGGIWSDFDIIFTASVEKKMNFNEDTIIFSCAIGGTCYYPIGFFLAKPNNKFFKFMMEQAAANYDPGSYQCIGTPLWGNLFPSVQHILNKNLGQIGICGNDYYLPWSSLQLNEFLSKEDNTLPPNNIGIHWFNGATQAKQYAIDLDSRLKNFTVKCFLDKFVSEYLKES